MRVRLDYGKRGLSVDLPDDNLIAVLGLTPAPPLTDPDRAIRDALEAPIAARPLRELARGRTSACVVICDITRPVPNLYLLPPVLETLVSCGIPQDAIRILIATGTHRSNEGAELETLVGSRIAGRYRVTSHNCKDRNAHIRLGESPRGLPVWIDRAYIEADLKITIGLIEPHFMAGYSGGRKLIMPGLAALDTIQRRHCPRFLESPLATNGIVDGNPVHEEALAIARLAPPDMILDVTLDDENRITGLFAGDLVSAWRAGVEFASAQVRAVVPQPADVVVTSGAGYPLDRTFYQAVKGMVSALPAVKPGGTILIAAECAEGVGSPDFTRTLFETDDLDAFVRHISKPDVFLPESWQVEELARAARHAKILCMADGIADEDLARCFVTPVAHVENALAAVLRTYGPDASLIAIPRGPYVIPVPKIDTLLPA